MRNRVIFAKMALGSVVLLGALSGCGGGDDPDAGRSNGGGDRTGLDQNSGESTTVGLNEETVASKGSIGLQLSNENISSSAPGTVTALVKDASGAPVKSVLVKFTVSGSTVAQVVPETALTNNDGIATTTVKPTSESQLGAGNVVATAKIPATGVEVTSADVGFSVSPSNVAWTSLTPAVTGSLNAYASTAIDFQISGASPSSPVTVQFGSECAKAGKADISPNEITITSITGSVTYRDKGCNGTDRITANIVGVSQTRSVDLFVRAPSTQGIQFISASPDNISIAGSGGSATSLVTFKVIDQAGNPRSGLTVDFQLDVVNIAKLSSSTGTTDQDGLVQVSVQSQLTPGPVRVKASLRASNEIIFSTVSSQLSINSGAPTQNSFSFAAEKYSLDAGRDGDKSKITIRLSDRFGNAVLDGTAVTFVSRGASVVPGRCQTLAGTCSVDFFVSNPRPDNGQVSVVAYAQGEESFEEDQGSSDFQYTDGEKLFDLGKVFYDLKYFTGENIDSNNQEVTFPSSWFIAGQGPNNTWDGNTFVRAQRRFFLAKSDVAPRIYEPSVELDPVTNKDVLYCDKPGTPKLLELNTLEDVLSPTQKGCRITRAICVRDANEAADTHLNPQRGGNPIPSGATLAVSTGAQGAVVSIDHSPITATPNGPTLHIISAALAQCSKPLEAPGPVDLTITMPHGQKYTYAGVTYLKAPAPAPAIPASATTP